MGIKIDWKKIIRSIVWFGWFFEAASPDNCFNGRWYRTIEDFHWTIKPAKRCFSCWRRLK